jgi:hypothetical protein
VRLELPCLPTFVGGAYVSPALPLLLFRLAWSCEPQGVFRFVFLLLLIYTVTLFLHLSNPSPGGSLLHSVGAAVTDMGFLFVVPWFLCFGALPLYRAGLRWLEESGDRVGGGRCVLVSTAHIDAFEGHVGIVTRQQPEWWVLEPCVWSSLQASMHTLVATAV